MNFCVSLYPPLSMFANWYASIFVLNGLDSTTSSFRDLMWQNKPYQTEEDSMMYLAFLGISDISLLTSCRLFGILSIACIIYHGCLDGPLVHSAVRKSFRLVFRRTAKDYLRLYRSAKRMKSKLTERQIRYANASRRPQNS